MGHIRAMRFLRLVSILVLGAMASGCMTSAESQAKRSEERCIARGYTPNTKEFTDCLVRVDNERDQRMERNRREMIEKPPDSPGGPRGY